MQPEGQIHRRDFHVFLTLGVLALMIQVLARQLSLGRKFRKSQVGVRKTCSVTGRPEVMFQLCGLGLCALFIEHLLDSFAPCWASS